MRSLPARGGHTPDLEPYRSVRVLAYAGPMTTPDNNDDATLDAIARQLEQIDSGPDAAAGGPSPADVPGGEAEQGSARAPVDPLVAIIAAIRAGLPQIALVPAFLGTRFTVPGRAENEDVSTFKPVVLSKDDQPFVPVFTIQDALGEPTETAPHRVSSTGRDLVTSLNESFGVVINPGTPHETELPPGLVNALRADIRRNAL